MIHACLREFVNPTFPPLLARQVPGMFIPRVMKIRTFSGLLHDFIRRSIATASWRVAHFILATS